MREIRLSDKHPFIAIVSDEDYAYLIQWRWTFKRSTRKHNNSIYACRNTTNGSRENRIKIMMHNVVLERAGKKRPTYRHTAHHINSKSLDNRRENLEWATAKKQERAKRDRNNSRHRDDRAA